MAKKLVLAYSGGLDTSVAIRWLCDRGYRVIAYMGDVGQGGNVSVLKKRAKIAGADKVIVENLKGEFIHDFIFEALKAGAIYESKYFLATALSRPLLAKGLVETAQREKAKFVAHGCTGKGNDQVRFEVTIASLNPRLKILAPVREWELPTREAEIRYAKQHKIPIDVTKKSPYSIDKNLWGVSIESGKLEDPYCEPAKDVYQWTKDPQRAPAKPQYVELYFKSGIPAKINGSVYSGETLIAHLNELGARFGVGRTDLVENRLVGIKSREIYEAPAATILHEAHKALESLILDRELAHFKEFVALKYAELIYYGLWYTPLKKALDKFIHETQKNVTGTVKLKLCKGACTVVGRKSPYSMYKKELATYGEGDQFDQSLAKGFIEIWGLPYKKQ
jgi:argininosuccinate synthase